MDVSASATATAGTRSSSSVAVPAPASAAATQSLQLLLRDDYLLTQHELHISKHSQEAAFGYAASLLSSNNNNENNSTASGSTGSGIQARATDALQEVERKLALVQSLAERVSRTSPEAVAGPLLRLHGYSIGDDDEEEKKEDAEQAGEEVMDASLLSTTSTHSATTTTTTTLVATRDRCHRLQRQSEVLEGVAKRVETTLVRGLFKMETATSRLGRVLALSSTLKMILRLQFEATKLQNYELDDLRDLTRAAASVAIVEDLLQQLQQTTTSTTDTDNNTTPDVVSKMKPAAAATALRVRNAAQRLLEQHQAGSGVVQLGATLQVYYHLGELPQAAWSAVQFGLHGAQYASDAFWSLTAISKLTDEALVQAKANSKTESALQRNLTRILRQARGQASLEWASSMSQSALQVWNLHRVLSRKTDPTTRQVFLQVVAQAPVPEELLTTSTTSTSGSKEFSVFTIFWDKLCLDLGTRLSELLQSDKGDVAALYPAVRSAVLGMLGRLYDTMQASSSSSSSSIDDATTSSSGGILGGSNALDAADFGMASADTWTRVSATDDASSPSSKGTTTSLSAIFSSLEWKSMQSVGLEPLQTAFLESCRNRLCTPIQFMFPEGLSVDEDGVASQVLPTLPSRYDMQKMDHGIRSELSLADPREGGGDLSMTTMIAQVVVDMVERFCARAKTAVTGDDACLETSTTTTSLTPTSNFLHDLKVAQIMNTLATTLKNAPENTFVVPYRPATSLGHEEAAATSLQALQPALVEIDRMVRNLILHPLCRALNRRIATAIGKMHHGTYLESALEDNDNADGPSFCQKQLVGLYEAISKEFLTKLPPDYAVIVATSIASFSIYTFVSNASLIRPLGETARLHITQDLAEFELALEQMVASSCTTNTMSLSQLLGKPYAELRAVRQMFYWTGLQKSNDTASTLSKAILREVWAKDVRPSTVFFFLFSFAPSLLSSPHHSKRMRPEQYVVSTLVKLDGMVDDGEVSAWMTTMACCDAYQQRTSSSSSGGALLDDDDGDRRIAAILMMLGPELLRRRRH